MGEVETGNRRIVTAALMMAMAVAALEQLVVTTAMPTIIARLKGVEIYTWVISAYLLASTVTMPLYGKLADRLGRKRVLLFGLGLFSLGSVLSGMAQSMPMLIEMRVLQGLGAGAIGPVVLTMIADMYPLAERAKVQGLFSAVWGVSSVAGPALGGVLTDSISWRAVFFVTVPFAVLAGAILAVWVREAPRHREPTPLDWPGAALLAAASATLLMAALGAQDRPWPASLGLLALAATFAALFVRQESRAADPVLPLDLVVRPPIRTAVLGSLLLGGVLFAVDTFVPLHVQGVGGGSATVTGRVITPMFLAWSISVALAAKVLVRWGFRKTATVGGLLIVLGALILGLGALRPEWSRPAFLAGLLVMGLGMGPTVLSNTLTAQNAVDWGRRGVATGAVLFARTIGGALGVGLLGAVLGYGLAGELAAAGAGHVDIAAALRPETRSLLAPEDLAIVKDALGHSLRLVFLLMNALAVAALACAMRLPTGTAPKPEPTLDDIAGAELAAIVET